MKRIKTRATGATETRWQLFEALNIATSPTPGVEERGVRVVCVTDGVYADAEKVYQAVTLKGVCASENVCASRDVCAAAQSAAGTDHPHPVQHGLPSSQDSSSRDSSSRDWPRNPESQYPQKGVRGAVLCVNMTLPPHIRVRFTTLTTDPKPQSLNPKTEKQEEACVPCIQTVHPCTGNPKP